jgi:hypothetical protein
VWMRQKECCMRLWKRCLAKWSMILSTSRGPESSPKSCKGSMIADLKLSLETQSIWTSSLRRIRWDLTFIKSIRLQDICTLISSHKKWPGPHRISKSPLLRTQLMNHLQLCKVIRWI